MQFCSEARWRRQRRDVAWVLRLLTGGAPFAGQHRGVTPLRWIAQRVPLAITAVVCCRAQAGDGAHADGFGAHLLDIASIRRIEGEILPAERKTTAAVVVAVAIALPACRSRHLRCRPRPLASEIHRLRSSCVESRFCRFHPYSAPDRVMPDRCPFTGTDLNLTAFGEIFAATGQSFLPFSESV